MQLQEKMNVIHQVTHVKWNIPASGIRFDLFLKPLWVNIVTDINPGLAALIFIFCDATLILSLGRKTFAKSAQGHIPEIITELCFSVQLQVNQASAVRLVPGQFSPKTTTAMKSQMWKTGVLGGRSGS